MRLRATLLAVLLLPALAGPAGADGQGPQLPVPRFVSLRADEVNLRTGPGVQYPVEWIYQRQNLPVEIVKEYRTWRLIRDQQGTQGWIHQSMLSGKRTFIATGKTRTVRSKPDADSRAVARMEDGAIGELLSCPAASGWCRVRAGGVEGWLRRVEFWGSYPAETVD